MVYYENFNLSISTKRFFSVYVPNKFIRNNSGVISKIFSAIFNNENILIHDDEEQTLDYTFDKDAIFALIKVELHERSIGEVYNIGTKKETSVNELVNIILDITHTKTEIKFIDKRDIDNIRRRVLNIEKIRSKLKWIPATNLEQGIRKTVKYYIENNG